MRHDQQLLDREFDRTQAEVFIGKTAAFLGSLLCSMELIWDENTKTAATDGLRLWWNPNWFLSLSPEARKTVLVHELWHPGKLHALRQGTRDKLIWNQACDIRINNDLENDGYSFIGLEGCWKDQSYGDMVEEDIYDQLVKSGQKPDPNKADMVSGIGESPNQNQILGNVVKAMQQATMAGQAGSIPGNTTKMVDKFLAPVVDWKAQLMTFFTDLLDTHHTWRRPSRRSTEIYLPSRVRDESRLTHLAYYLDVSGSITSKDVLRFNSEVKYIKDVLKPITLTLVQFDTMIRDVKVIEDHEAFDKIEIKGGGGTSLICVKKHIEEIQPTAAIIFTDLQVAPMEPLKYPIPVIWIGIHAAGKSVPFGKLIHIRN